MRKERGIANRDDQMSKTNNIANDQAPKQLIKITANCNTLEAIDSMIYDSDVKYSQRKLYSALKVPTSYLGNTALQATKH